MSLDKSARALRTLVERFGYRTFHLAFGDGNVLHQKWRRFAERLDEPLRGLVSLFLLQRPVDEQQARAMLGTALLDDLLEADVLRVDGGAVRSTGLVLISFRSLLFFFELTESPRVYFGLDSQALGRYQQPAPGGLTLDIGSGCGIQAMIAAGYARHTYAVEIDERAAAIAAINFQLNDLQDRVTMIHGSLEEYAARVSEPFDLITFNLPQLPAPPGIDYPVGNGGADGLAMTRRALELYLPHLAQNGSVELIGCGLGRDGRPLFLGELGALLAEHGVHGHAQTIGLTELRRGDQMYDFLVQIAAMSNGLTAEQSEALFEEHFRALERNELYTFFLHATRTADGSGLTVANLAEPGKDWLA